MSVLKAKDPQTGEFSAQYGVSVNDGYNAGKLAERSAFWDSAQNYGKRVNYEGGFSGESWTDKTFYPKYDIKPTNITYLFRRCGFDGSVKERLAECGVVLDLSSVKKDSMVQPFAYAKCTEFPALDISHLSSPSLSNWFLYSQQLKTIEKLVINETCTFDSGTFKYCYALENIAIEGTIGQNGINFSWSPLTHDSLMSIINALQTKTSGTWTVTLGVDNLAKLTDAEKAIATQKGWTLA